MKTMKRLIAVLLLSAMMMTALTGCGGNARKIKDTLSEFEYACHNLDMDAMLDCIDPDVAEPIQFALSVYSIATDQDVEDLTDLFVDSVFGSNASELDAEELLSYISITDQKVKVKKSTAAVSCSLSVELDGKTYDMDLTINMTKTDGRWYIAGIEFPETLEE